MSRQAQESRNGRDTSNEPRQDEPQLTKQSRAILLASTAIAQGHGQSVGPLHLFLVLLCGPAVNINQLEDFTPTDPSHLWKAVSALDSELDPKKLAQVTKLLILPPRTAPPPLPEPPRNDRNHALHRSRLDILRRQRRNSLNQQQEPRDSHVHSLAPEAISRSQSPGPTSEDLVTVFQRASDLRKESLPHDSHISPYHLSLAVIEHKTISDILTQNQTTQEDVARELRVLKPPPVTTGDDSGYSYLSRFATDMLALARNNKLDETIGRDEEIRRLMQILCRRTKNSAILIGEPGVGKTAVVEGLARRLADRQVPNTLKGTLFSLDLGALFAGAGKGEYEERVKGVINDVKRSQETGSPIILFIDEIHLLCVGKGQGGQSGMDAANLLKPELARGQFRCIGATTLSEYREYIEKDGALTRRFAQVIVNEPTPEQAITILRGVRERYESHHNIWIMDSAITSAVNLAHRYLTARRLPDSAFDLMDEACASSRLQHDLQPESYEKVNQSQKEKVAYISALERDDKRDNDDALTDARKSLAELKEKMKQLERDQDDARKHWESIANHRKTIARKREDLVKARSEAKPNEKKITLLDKELQQLRDQLVKLEKPRQDASATEAQHMLLSPPGVITQENIAMIVEKMTKIPVRQLLSSDKRRLLNIHNALKEKVKGQQEAVDAVANAIQISRTGLGNANRPIAVFLFTGPSGTGKTLISKSLAEELFGQSTAMVRIDGSEYSQSHSVSRLIGAPPGYVGYDQGGQLTEYVRRTPYCIVLLDEIEKACFEFWTIFLQVMDEGRLTDGQGRVVDFRNTVIIMTSNVGADLISRTRGPILPEVKDAIIRRFNERGLPPEFINRIDEVVMFKPMEQDVMKQILNQQIDELRKRDGLKNITLHLSDKAQTWLIQNTISAQYGARLLTRVLQTQILNPLARAILTQEVQEKCTVSIQVRPDQKGLELQVIVR
ncbi:P-loop containing nucleoside triphosphate hydrolase protein [Chiua virens]|nr:P-loop containing nucleoside triphosphate hydrolase protein [Chiua virens]